MTTLVKDQHEGDNFHEEDNSMEVFSRRKLESNWDRYEASERQEPDDETPAQRGTDYHVLMESAGDSFTQFRFSEEKDWEMDSSAASQMSAVFVDLPALAQTLQQVPLHQRLNLEAELLQVSTPVELPTMTLPHKKEIPRISTFTPPPAALKVPCSDQKVPVATNPATGSHSQVPSLVEDDGDEELDQLLSLQKPVPGNQSVNVGERTVPEREREEVKEVTEERMQEVKDKDVTPPKSASVKQEMTEEDLEDWLDSMIS
ncbi:cell death regulator Aven isoform X2 [Eleginops maclovinus]|uniref:cell death regulator Aven isoform X2 n=1 Tax=Eleginops maclovinus TaxID=56733 RepID=UPI003080B562